MTRMARWRLARLMTGVALALSVGVLFAPATAQASCGDYVLVGGRPAGDGTHADPHMTAQSMPHADRHMPMTPGNGHVPCSGPMCSREPLSLPLSPAPASPVRPDLWGCTTALLLAADSDSA